MPIPATPGVNQVLVLELFGAGWSVLVMGGPSRSSPIGLFQSRRAGGMAGSAMASVYRLACWIPSPNRSQSRRLSPAPRCLIERAQEILGAKAGHRAHEMEVDLAVKDRRRREHVTRRVVQPSEPPEQDP